MDKKTTKEAVPRTNSLKLVFSSTNFFCKILRVLWAAFIGFNSFLLTAVAIPMSDKTLVLVLLLFYYPITAAFLQPAIAIAQGKVIKYNSDIIERSDKSWGMTLLLTVCFGWLGIHRFYLGRKAWGFMYLFSFGGCGIGWIVDVFLVLMGMIADKDGKLVKKRVSSGKTIPQEHSINYPEQHIYVQETNGKDNCITHTETLASKEESDSEAVCSETTSHKITDSASQRNEFTTTDESITSGADATVEDFLTQTGELEIINDCKAKEPEEIPKRPEYSIPPVSLLKHYWRDYSSDNTNFLRTSVRQIESVLTNSFVDAHIISVIAGPISIRYELELGIGVRLIEIQNLTSEFAFALGCENVSITRVVGKASVVALDAPRLQPTTVSLREVIDSSEFKRNNSGLKIALGKNTIGNDVICDLVADRHLIIGGTTGIGKSNLIHTIILSLLCQASPDDVKFMMIDTKGLELTYYNGIPHMLIPVVTDTRKAKGAIQWLNVEMQRRFRTLSESGYRSFDLYNISARESGGKLVPHIVAIVDDFSHLTSFGNDAVEEDIRDIIMRGHITGVHLILSTQHAYTGAVVKLTNLRNAGRIAFSLPSRLDSIALLGKEGAEKLSGRGEMLYYPLGNTAMEHIQGCLVSDPEIESVVSYIKEQDVYGLQDELLEEIEKSANMFKKDSKREERMHAEEFLAAVDVIFETNQASVSMLQRRLKLGYAYAARLVDEMEEKGIVGPFMGSKPRQILISREQWEEMKRSGKF